MDEPTIGQVIEIDPSAKYAFVLKETATVRRVEELRALLLDFWEDPAKHFIVACGVEIRKVGE